MRWSIVDAVRAVLGVLLALLIAPEGWAVASYRLQGNQPIEVNYERQLAESEGRQAATAKEHERLLREHDRARGEAEEWAQQLAAETLGMGSDSYREALRLFRHGQPGAALERLSEDSLRREAAEARQKLEDPGQRWLLRGRILALRLDFAGADRAYAEAVKVAPASFEAWFQYGNFHQQQNRNREARQGYARALPLARRAGSHAEVAQTLNNLGVLHSDENRKADARQAYEEALRIRRVLALKNPAAYLPDVALTLNNLGLLHCAENRMADAREDYEEALRTYRALAQKNQDVYLPYVAGTLTNLGVLHFAENRKRDAHDAFEEARSIFNRFVEVAPATYEPRLRTVESNLAELGE